MTDINKSGTLIVGANWVACTCTDEGPRGCRVHDASADDSDGDKLFEYECLMLNEGQFTVQTLSGQSTGHAFEEASYEFEGQCLAARRGEYLGDN